MCENERSKGNKEDGVNVCVVYASCFPLFSLDIFCVSECESKKLFFFLEETTKAFISVGNNRLQSCLPSAGMNST